MDERGHTITTHQLLWDLLVFAAAVVSVASVTLEVLFDWSESELIILYLIDVAALTIFIIDLWILWSHYNGPLRSFLFRNWVDVLACIPLFRLLRLARFSRLLKLSRLRRLLKLRRVGEVREKIQLEKKQLPKRS